MDLREQDILGDAIGEHWYYRSKRRAMLALIADMPVRRVLDIGAGSGFFSREILRHTTAEGAVCVDPNYPADHDETEAGKPMHFRRAVTTSDADLMLLMDVLEHVDDDIGLLRGYTRLATPRTQVLITVPACQWLWSGHDVYLDHRRRYSLAQLEAVAGAAGITIERSCYFFAAVFPIAAGLRLPEAVRGALTGRGPEARSSMRRHGGFTNTLLEGLCRTELPFFRFNRLFGLSVFLHGRVAQATTGSG